MLRGKVCLLCSLDFADSSLNTGAELHVLANGVADAFLLLATECCTSETMHALLEGDLRH